MRSPRDLAERLKDCYTRVFARLVRTPIEERGSVKVTSDEEMDVYWFSEDSAKLAQNIPFADTIILNRWILERVPPESKEVVIEHERSHQERNSFIRGIWLSITLPGLVLGPWSLLLAGLWVARGAQASAVAEVVYIGASLSFIGCVLNRGEETIADLDALHAVGEERFIRGYEAIKSGSEGGVVDSALRRLFYNSPESTRKLYRHLQKFGLYTK